MTWKRSVALVLKDDLMIDGRKEQQWPSTHLGTHPTHIGLPQGLMRCCGRLWEHSGSFKLLVSATSEPKGLANCCSPKCPHPQFNLRSCQHPPKPSTRSCKSLAGPSGWLLIFVGYARCCDVVILEDIVDIFQHTYSAGICIISTWNPIKKATTGILEHNVLLILLTKEETVTDIDIPHTIHPPTGMVPTLLQQSITCLPQCIRDRNRCQVGWPAS